MNAERAGTNPSHSVSSIAGFTNLATWFRRWTAFSAAVLLVATYRLWLPQTVFPRVPLIEAAVGWSDGVDLLAYVALFCGLLLTITPQRKRFGWFAFVVAFGLAVLVDQHRLQPWAWQFALLAVVFTTAGPARQLQLARWLAIGIVFHSAHSKLDFAFLDEQGRVFLEFLASFLGVDTKFWGEGTWRSLALLLPAGELLVAIGLVVPRTRRIAAWLLIAMHLILLAVFTGLAHSWGVLLWNVFAIGEVLLLFTPWRAANTSPLFTLPNEATTSLSTPDSEPGTPPTRRRSFLWLGEFAVAIGVIAPFLEPFGLVDHWLAWSVYSARTEKVSIFIPAGSVADLPKSARPYVFVPPWGGPAQLRLDTWSLDTLGVPLYPQERFRLGAALAVVKALPEDVEFRILLDGLPDRFDGERERTVVDTREALQNRAATYPWNAIPKRTAR